MSRPVQLPENFSACERGNVLLSCGSDYVGWMRLGKGLWLEVSLCPDNYPALNVATIERTDEQLAEHIRTKVGWTVHKLNLEGCEVSIDSANEIIERPES